MILVKEIMDRNDEWMEGMEEIMIKGKKWNGNGYGMDLDEEEDI